MSTPNDELLILADAVINPPAAYENEIEAAIKALLRRLEFESETRAVAGGEADIYLPNNNLVIETKDRGKVSATPKTLWEQLNFQNKLMKQFVQPADHTHKVTYNTSGQVLRAARIAADTVVESGCYYLTATDIESAYITCMLNAPCLQTAFQESRESDRHFHLHTLNKVPIPRFDPEAPDHLKLVELCQHAEVVAQEVIDGLPHNTGQIKASNLIRIALISEGIADAIDAVARRVLPSHSVMRYSDQYPHPWKSAK